MENIVNLIKHDEEHNQVSIDDEELEYFYKLWEEDRL